MPESGKNNAATVITAGLWAEIQNHGTCNINVTEESAVPSPQNTRNVLKMDAAG
jgi:hypothetical protein